MKKAVILLSGGLDSATCLALAKSMGYSIFALTINYGQRHKIEIKKAAALAKKYKVIKHVILKLDMTAWGGSALTSNIPVPKAGRAIKIGSTIPVTYVPARNTIFLSLALSFAEAVGASDIFIGANAVDFSGYPDCRPAFIKEFQTLANVATKAGVEGKKIKIHTPLLHKSKAEIIKMAVKLKVDFSLTHSCYNPLPSEKPCGVCESCALRRKGFEEAGVKDSV